MFSSLNQQDIFPILALLIFMGVFVAASVRSLSIRREDAQVWARLALEENEGRRRNQE